MTTTARRAREACGVPETLLAFSCGKDSWAAWIAAREAFGRVLPFYQYLVPGLEFVEEYLVYAERVLGERVVQLPHRSLYRMLGHYTFQPPERCAVIDAAELPAVEYPDIIAAAREEHGAPEAAWTASGVRAADSPLRRMALGRSRGLTPKRKLYYPCWDWRKADVIDVLKRHGIRLPVDYQLFGRSFDGLDLRFLLPLRARFPRDYRRLLEFFPLADLEIFRYEHR